MLTAGAFEAVSCTTILFGLDASTWDLEETVGTVVGRDVDCHASIASDLVAFVAKIQRVEWVKGIARGWRVGGQAWRWSRQRRLVSLGRG